MKIISIDIETYSSVNLIKSGVYKYAESPDFEILLFAYSVDGAPVEIIDLKAGEKIPAWIQSALMLSRAEDIRFHAYNAQFERVCLGAHLGYTLSPALWECTQVHAVTIGLPFNLELVAAVLKLSEQKDTAGKALIKYFCVPCKPKKSNGYRTRNLPEHSPESWELFKSYCMQDVRTEQAVKQKLLNYPISAKERRLYELDQRINDTGIKLDSDLITAAMTIDFQNSSSNNNKAKELTGLKNPNSTAQLKTWFATNFDVNISSLNKEVVSDLVKEIKEQDPENEGEALQMLELRQEMSKSSIKKYTAMLAYKCADNKARGLLQFYGASRTGRWAGRGIQVQNLARIHMKDIATARNIIKYAGFDLAALLYDNIADTLSQLIRTAFIASAGCRLIVSDFSAIEARVTAWLAGERWRLDVFATHGQIYEASASQMFKLPIEKIDKTTRQRGKVAELALGFGGGVAALVAMGALKMGLTEEELPDIVKMWRRASPGITQLWRTIQMHAETAINSPGMYSVFKFEKNSCKIRFIVERGILFIELPSGRRLAYLSPSIREGKYGKIICYRGVDQDTKKWSFISAWGGKLFENIVQAIARDLLAEKMLLVDAAGYRIVLHVHDEIVCDMKHGSGNIYEIGNLMCRPVAWAPGLVIKAESYESEFYKKD